MVKEDLIPTDRDAQGPNMEKGLSDLTEKGSHVMKVSADLVQAVKTDL